MAEFIAKKREMFLVQMSLDTKREEIRKLEEKARMKEEALRKSEQASIPYASLGGMVDRVDAVRNSCWCRHFFVSSLASLFFQCSLS